VSNARYHPLTQGNNEIVQRRITPPEVLHFIHSSFLQQNLSITIWSLLSPGPDNKSMVHNHRKGQCSSFHERRWHWRDLTHIRWEKEGGRIEENEQGAQNAQLARLHCQLRPHGVLFGGFYVVVLICPIQRRGELLRSLLHLGYWYWAKTDARCNPYYNRVGIVRYVEVGNKSWTKFWLSPRTDNTRFFLIAWV